MARGRGYRQGRVPGASTGDCSCATASIEPSTRPTIHTCINSTEVGTHSTWHHAANAATSPTPGGRPAICPKPVSYAMRNCWRKTRLLWAPLMAYADNKSMAASKVNNAKVAVEAGSGTCKSTIHNNWAGGPPAAGTLGGLSANAPPFVASGGVLPPARGSTFVVREHIKHHVFSPRSGMLGNAGAKIAGLVLVLCSTGSRGAVASRYAVPLIHQVSWRCVHQPAQLHGAGCAHNDAARRPPTHMCRTASQ